MAAQILRFTKMHGAGNDYVYVSAFEHSLPPDLPALAQAVSDRHRGIGGDGLVVIGPSSVAHARMRMYNADGSEAEMCGNAIRCVAKYVYDRGLVRANPLTIETGAGVLTLELTEIVHGRVEQVRVNMGPPMLLGERIPTTLVGTPPMNVELTAGGRTFPVTCVSMGNPHCVTYVEALTDAWVLEIGPQIEHHAAFPRRVNAEFVQVLGPSEVRMRVWERGSGETQACGTGAAAVCVAGVLTGRTGTEITVHLPGGQLHLSWPDRNGPVFMTGPATEVFSGDWPLES